MGMKLRRPTVPMVRRAICIASVVGPTLVLINQGDLLFGEGTLNYAKAALTALVPFCVSMFSAMATTEETCRP